MSGDGIVTREGPAGPRAALGPGGPDVWEVIAALRAAGNRPERAARYLGVDVEDVRRAERCHRRDPAPVEARLAAERDLAARAEARWRRERRA